MRSRAHIKGHPIHAILVTFPIAFLAGAFILDMLWLFTGNSGYEDAAVYATAGGLMSGVVAAIPGIIDYTYSVPPASSASRRGGWHAALNGCALLLFTCTLLMRLKTDAAPALILLIEGLGVTLLGVAGWMGGTLVVRNQIGVDHRYAGAGKWQEETLAAVNGRVRLTNLDALQVNQMKLLHVDGKRIVVGRTAAGPVAFDDFCTHRGGSLADGALICETVQCPWHGSQFHVRTGQVKAGPAKQPIKTYALTEDGGAYWLTISEPFAKAG